MQPVARGGWPAAAAGRSQPNNRRGKTATPTLGWRQMSNARPRREIQKKTAVVAPANIKDIQRVMNVVPYFQYLVIDEILEIEIFIFFA